MTRVKVTIPPPRVCGKRCWWRLKYLRAEARLHALRRELVAYAAKYNALLRESKRRERDADDFGQDGEDIPDELTGILR